MLIIRQNATHKVVLGPAVAVGDGFTPVTNLDVSTADEAEAIKHDNGTVVDISGYTWAAIATADAYYHLTLQSAISGTVGHMTVVINDDSLCLPLRADFMVIEEAVYDAMYAASAAGPLQSTTAGRKLDVTAGGNAAIDWGNIENATAEIDLTQTTVNAVTSIAQVAGFSASGKAEIEAEVNDALVALNLDHLMKTAVGNNADMTTEVVDGTVLSNLMSATSDTSTYVVADDSLQGNSEGVTTAHSTTDGLIAAVGIQADRNADLIESQRGSHTWHGNACYVETDGNDSTGDGSRALPYKTLQAAHDDLVITNNHDVIFLGPGTHTTAATVTFSKSYFFIRGRGRNTIITRTGSGDTIAITGDGIEISGTQIGTAATGSGHGVKITDADFARIQHCWFLDTRGDGVHILRGSNCQIHDNDFDGTGVAGSGDGIHIVGTAGSSNGNSIFNNEMHGTLSDAILIEQGTTNDTLIYSNDIHDAGGWGINIGGSSTRAVVYGNVLGNNSSGDITDGGSSSVIKQNRDWLSSTTESRTLDVTAAGEAGLDLDNTSGTIIAAQLGADCITAAKIADDAIAAEHLATGAFTADAFAADALVAATFAASSLDGKGDWNTTVPDAAGTAATLHGTTDGLIADVPTVSEFNARTLVAASYFDASTDEVITDAASRTASKATSVTVSDKTGFKLASDGLDQISAAEPTGKPTTFAGWVMWLVQRFRRSKLTEDTLTVEKEDGTAVTTQTVSDDGTTQQMGAPS